MTNWDGTAIDDDDNDDQTANDGANLPCVLFLILTFDWPSLDPRAYTSCGS